MSVSPAPTLEIPEDVETIALESPSGASKSPKTPTVAASASYKLPRRSTALSGDTKLGWVEKHPWLLQVMFIAFMIPVVVLTILTLRLSYGFDGESQLWRTIVGLVRLTLAQLLNYAIYSTLLPTAFQAKEVWMFNFALVVVDAIGVIPRYAFSPLDPSDESMPWKTSSAFKIAAIMEGTFGVAALVGNPLLFMWRQGLRNKHTVSDTSALGFKSKTMAVGCVLMLVGANSAPSFTAFGIDLLSVSFLTIVPWLVALLLDVRAKRMAEYRGCVWYALAFTFLIEGLASGAAASLIGYVEVVSSFMDEYRQVVVFFLFSFTYSGLRSVVGRTMRTFFGSKDGLIFMFVVQLFEDVFLELAFLGVASFSGAFFLIMSITIVRQLVRDTTVVKDSLGAWWRRFRGKPEPTLAEERHKFEVFSRVMEQNLLSEMLAAVFVPLALWSDTIFTVGKPTVTAGLSQEAIADQLVVYVFLLFVELAVHRLVHVLLQRRLDKLRGSRAAVPHGMQTGSSRITLDIGSHRSMRDVESGLSESAHASMPTIADTEEEEVSSGASSDGEPSAAAASVAKKPLYDPAYYSATSAVKSAAVYPLKPGAAASWEPVKKEKTRRKSAIAWLREGDEYERFTRRYFQRNYKIILIAVALVVLDTSQQFRFIQKDLVRLGLTS
eukprot:PLAT4432.2.p1 GENE.PLAT4432.2~~PLAT4432.2.p1  ORF type:complete len:665 (+),score=272.81 PLAT4432.2:57-2051(+)